MWHGGNEKGARSQESTYTGSVELCMLEMKVERADRMVPSLKF